MPCNLGSVHYFLPAHLSSPFYELYSEQMPYLPQAAPCSVAALYAQDVVRSIRQSDEVQTL
jgi:hypothetical protein